MGKVARHPLTILLYVLIAPILVSLISAKIIDRDKDFKSMAPIEYVDKANTKQDIACEKAMSHIETELDKKADKDDVDKVISDVNYTREKVDKIYLLLIEQKND